MKYQYNNNLKKIKLGLVCTTGGHFEQMTNLSKLYNCYDHFWITNKSKQTEAVLDDEKKYFVGRAHYKKPWKYLYQLPDMIKAFLTEKPTHIISTGSGVTTFIPFLLAKALNRKFIHIDTFSRVYNHSKFGSFLLKLKQPILTQWKDRQNKKVMFIGPIFETSEFVKEKELSEFIFITLGTRVEQFNRIINAVEKLVKEGAIKEKVYVQAGYTKYRTDRLEIFEFCTPEQIQEYVKKAKYVITQESAGIGSLCLKYKTKFIVMPRKYQYGELSSKTDMDEDLHWKLEKMGYTRVVNNEIELMKAIEEVDSLKSGFEFNNTFAIKELRKIIDK